MSGMASLTCPCGASLTIEPWYAHQMREWREQHNACLHSLSTRDEVATAQRILQVRSTVVGVLTMHRQRRDFRGEPVGCSCGAVEPYRNHLAREIADVVVPR